MSKEMYQLYTPDEGKPQELPLEKLAEALGEISGYTGYKAEEFDEVRKTAFEAFLASASVEELKESFYEYGCVLVAPGESVDLADIEDFQDEWFQERLFGKEVEG